MLYISVKIAKKRTKKMRVGVGRRGRGADMSFKTRGDKQLCETFLTNKAQDWDGWGMRKRERERESACKREGKGTLRET